jgi:hypothetical protein
MGPISPDRLEQLPVVIPADLMSQMACLAAQLEIDRHQSYQGLLVLQLDESDAVTR